MINSADVVLSGWAGYLRRLPSCSKCVLRLVLFLVVASVFGMLSAACLWLVTVPVQGLCF